MPKNKELPEPGVACPLSPCIKLLAGAWTLEIIYFIKGKPIRFGQLRRSLGKVSSKVLTTRLRELEDKGVVIRKVIPTNPPMVEYSLSPLGKELLPILNAMTRVGQKLLTHYKVA